MRHGDFASAGTVLLAAALLCVGGPHLPRAPLWNLVAAAASPAGEVPRDLAPRSSAAARADLEARFVREALATAPALAAVLEASRAAGTGVEPLPARLLGWPLPMVAGPGTGWRPAACAARPPGLVGAGVAHGAVAIGTVARVDGRVAWIRPLTDPRSRVAVEVLPGDTAPRAESGRVRPRGVVRGRGPAALLQLVHVPADADVRPGDRVVTSGRAGGFPAGLTVGTVVGTGESASGAVLELDVAPAATLDEAEALACLVPLAEPARVAR